MSRDITAGGASIVIGIKNRLAKGAAQVQSDLRKLGSKLRSQGASLAKIGGTISASIAGPAALIIREASQMEETMGKFGVVFGDNSEAVKKWSDATANAMGVSEQSMAAMLSGMQDLLVPMGVAPNLATDMSKTLSGLAVDLGSFNNMNPDQVFGDLMAAMTGSGEVMKKYGVILSEAAVQQELMNMGLDPKNTNDAAKAQARLNIIMRGTTAAQGDAIRTGGSFANQMKRLWAAVKDSAAAIGGPLLEDLAALLQVVNAGVASFKNFVKENQGLVKVVALAVLAVGGIGAALLATGAAISLAGFAFTGLATAIGLLFSPIALAIGGVAALGIGILKYTDLGGQAIDWLKERFGPLVETVKGAVTAIMEALRAGDMSAAWELTVETLELIWLDMTEGVRNAWASVMDFVLNAGSSTAEAIGMIFQGVATVLAGILDSYKSVYDSIYNFTEEKLSALGNKITGVRTIGGKAAPKGSAFESQMGGLEASIRSAIDGVRQFGEGMEMEGAQQKIARAEAREQQRAQREARREELTASLRQAGEVATVAKEERESREKALKESIKIEGGDFQAATKTEGGKPTATFSAFAAAIAGGPSTVQRVEDPKSLRQLEIINRNLEKQLRRNNVGAVFS